MDLEKILSESGKTDLQVLLSVKEQAKQAALSDPTPQNLAALDRANRMLENQLSKQKADGETPPEFKETKTAAAVLRYLQAAGWQIEKTQLYQHVKEGKLKKSEQGKFTERAVRKYAKDWLKRADTGKKVGDEQDDLQREKLQEEIQRIRAQREREQFKLDTERGKYLPRDEIEQMLAGRAAALEAGYDHMVYSRVQEWIALAGGDPAKASTLIDAMMEAKNEWFNQYARLDEFEVEFKANDEFSTEEE